MIELSLVQRLAVLAVPVLFAITLHEVAHGWVARLRGDTTAWRLGRLSLNPIRHIDPVGTILVPILTFVAGGILFGWARPVPVDWRNLHHPRQDMALVALAGPSANLLMALAWALVVHLTLLLAEDGGTLGWFLVYSGVAGMLFNIVLMVLNLLPLPPLDGGRILAGILPPRAAAVLDRVEPWGIWILVALLFTGLLGRILWPLIDLVQGWVVPVSGLSPGQYVSLVNLLLGG